MQKKSFSLFQCWKNERIGQVINKEAASVDTATFLATHAPLNKLTYHRAPQSVIDSSENGLLQELHSCAEQDRHAFVVVQGIPGTGKSHLIRWLKERYAADADQQHERVLFIERAQCSLRNTLEQIIHSGVFDKDTMKEQLEKLDGARIELSKDALAQTLLDQIRIAAGELPQIEMPKLVRRNDRWERFLLDVVVRQQLLKAGGPIERIVRFLGRGTGMLNREMPKFEESDFDFKAKIRSQIAGYLDARDVADILSGEDGIGKRQALAAYVNKLLPFAIGHATALTSDDFKQIFYDLRRQLRRQQQSLILFIEDITALTGIDAGLLDVLATQHVGEGNQEFCRIVSVVGITDNYFLDHVPDNMKDRVTHRLTLNASQTRLSDAELLSDANTTADLAARYLNVMRLKQQDLDEWLRQGGKTTQLPNACSGCSFKAECHAAFGTQRIPAGGEEEQDIGLYPFNQKAIWTLYQHIDTTTSKRTPRSLLHNVLHYILQSHGPKVKQGSFPPPSTELGSEFTVFSLIKPLQSSVIASQGKEDARRIETLSMIWGNGTIDVEQNGARTLVGDLPSEVFQAFGIQPIAGEHISVVPQKKPDKPGTTEPGTGKIAETVRGEYRPLTKSQPQAEEPSRYVKDITNWFHGGKLVYYRDYLDLLVPLLHSFIDWNFYRINEKQLEEALKGRRIEIERQEGQVNAAHYLTLKCEPEFVAVLLALVAIRERGQALEDAVLSGGLSSISIWLRMHEAEIVQFVQQPHRAVSNLLPLHEMLLFCCVIMACLQGALRSSYESAQDLWLDLVKFCVQTKNSPSEWGQYQQKVELCHSRIWANMVKQIMPKTASDLCSLLLAALNCSQGGSSEVRFLDAPTALHLLKQLQESDWQLPTTSSLDKNALALWSNVVTIYTNLSRQFVAALEDDSVAIQNLLVRLSAFSEGESVKEVFQAIRSFVKVMAEAQRGTSFALKQSLNATQFTAMQNSLLALLKEQEQGRRTLLLGNIGILYPQVQEYISYFEDFVKEATKLKEVNTKRLNQLQDQMNSENLSRREEVRSMYGEIADILDVQLVREERG